MAIKIWRGDAQGVAQVTKVTISNVEVGDVFTLTVNRKSVSFTATEEGDPEGIDNVLAGLAAAWEASTEDELESVAAVATDTTTDTTDAGYGYKDTLVLTGGSDGEPFTVAGTTSDGGSKTVAVTTLTAGDAGTNEKQVVSLPGPPTGGTFTLTFEGYTTGNIAYNASAATVETAFEALTSVGAGNGTVTGDAAGPWTIEFTGSLAATNVSVVTGNGTNLTGGASITVAETTEGGTGSSNEKWTLQLGTGFSAFESAEITINISPSTTRDYTIPFSLSATGADIKNAMDSSYGPAFGNYNVTGSAGGPWTFEFTGDNAGTDLSAPLVVNSVTDTGIEYTSPTDPSHYQLDKVQDGGAGATDEVQVVTLNNGPTGGTFTLTFEGQTTSALTYDESAADMETALEALSTIDGCSVAGSDGGPWTVTFNGSAVAGRDLALMTAANSLTGSSVSVSTTQAAADAANEVQQVDLEGDVTGGTFTLTWDPGGGDETTGNIAYNATAATVQAALEALATPTSGDFSVTGSAGGPWIVTFTGSYAATDVNAMSGNGTNLTGAGTQSINVNTTTSPTGPNWVDNADNWHNVSAPTTATLPVNSDTVIFGVGDVDALWGLDQLSAVTLTELEVRSSYTGRIGLAERDNANDVYWEYRPSYFEIGATTMKIGTGSGSGSPRLKINTGSVQTSIEVTNTGVSEDSGLAAFRWKGTHASNALRVQKGEVGIAVEGGEAATLLTLDIGYESNEESDANVSIGDNATITTITKSGGELTSRSGISGTFTQEAGDSTFYAGAIPEAHLRGGQVDWASTGNLGTAPSISGATKADPCVITTSSAHGFSDGDRVYISGVAGMTDLNGNTYTIEVATSTTFNLVGVDSSAFGTYSSGGTAALVGSIRLSGDAVLNLEASAAAKSILAPIMAFGSSRVFDRAQTASPLIVDKIDGDDEDGRFLLGRSYRLERGTPSYP